MTVIELIGRLKAVTHAEDFEVMIEDEVVGDAKSVRVDRGDRRVILSTDEGEQP